MLLPIFCTYILIQFCLGFAAVVNTTVNEDNVQPGIGGNHLPSLSLQDVKILLSEVQHKLHAMEETHEFLMSRVNIESDSEQRTSTNQKRIRREVARNPQTIPNLQETNGTVGCPESVRPYSVGGSCILCPTGPRGYPGPSGPPGRDGRDGRDSLAVITATGNVDDLHFPESRSDTSGSVYVRWGHSECPSYSKLIYAGSAAGSHFSSPGSGANQLCLPDKPDYDNPVAGIGGFRAFLYSIEFQINDFPSLESHNWFDVSCAVCKAPSRFSQLMIPGKQSCPSAEWTLEYSGFLMAERSNTDHKRSMFVCVDRAMQSLEGTHGYSGYRGLFNLVEGRCTSDGGGGLPCESYIDGYEITCAVCTQ